MVKIIFLKKRIRPYQRDSQHAMRNVMGALAVFGLLILAGEQLHAGNLKLIRATRQDWSGGVEGLQGTRFEIEIAAKKGRSNLIPLQLWIGDHCFSLRVSDPQQIATPGNMKVIHTKKSVTWKIFLEAERPEETGSSGNRNGVGPNRSKLQEGNENRPVYKGAALLIYRKGEQRCCLVIDEFNALPALAYP